MTDRQIENVRRTIHFSGTVQGVGFRYMTRHIASRFEVTGFVKNLSDGRVELVTEGNLSDVEQFEQAVHDTLGTYISDAEVTTSPATREFATFDIAF